MYLGREPVTGDRWQVTGDRWQVTGDRWQVTGIIDGLKVSGLQYARALALIDVVYAIVETFKRAVMHKNTRARINWHGQLCLLRLVKRVIHIGNIGSPTSTAIFTFITLCAGRTSVPCAFPANGWRLHVQPFSNCGRCNSFYL